MKILNLTLSAFGPFANSETIDFQKLNDAGIFLISGKTGAGKTTLFDAISYAIYGKTSSKDREKEQIRSHYANDYTETFVKLLFQINNKNYEIVRYPKQMMFSQKSSRFVQKESFVELKLFDTNEVYSKTTSANEKIIEIMGISEDHFRSIIMIPQGEFREFIFSSVDKKKEILSKLFSTHIYSNFEERVDIGRKEAQEELKEINLKLAYSIERLVLDIKIDNTEPFTILPQIETRIALDKKEYNQLINQIEIITNIIGNNKVELEKAFENNKTLERIHILENNFLTENMKSSQIEEIKIEIEKIEKAVNLLSYNDRLEDAIKERDRILNELEQSENELVLRKNDYESNIISYNSLNEINSSIDNKKDNLKKIGEIIELFSKYNVIKSEFEISKIELSELKKELSLINDSYEELKSEIEKDSLQFLEIEKFRLQLGILEDEYNKGRTKEKISNDLVNLERELVNLSIDKDIAQENLNLLKIEYNQIYKSFIESYSSFIASELKEGQMCPVCGSTNHPQKSNQNKDFISKDELDETENKLKIKQNEFDNILIKFSTLKERFASKKIVLEEFISIDLNQLNEKQNNILKLKNEILRIENLKNDQSNKNLILTQIKEKLDQTDERIIIKDDKLKLLNYEKDRIKIKISDYELEKLIVEKEILEKEIIIAKESIEKIRNRYDESYKSYVTLSEYNQNLIKNLERINCQIHEWSNKFNERLKVENFDVEEFKKAKKRINEKDFLNKFIIDHDKLISELDTNIKVEKAKLYSFEKMNIEALKTELIENENRKLIYDNKIKELHLKIEMNERSKNEIIEILPNLMNVTERFESYMKLFNTFKKNNMRLSLETYVLIEFFNEVLELANIRFRKMTDSRYEMIRFEDRSRGNQNSGLEIMVMDYNTSKSRSIRTLSGGESFKASLSLALGLSELVTRYSGNIRLDTMFIDEGFGSLDPESLEKAISELLDLKKTNRIVGIISHVSELKERISSKIEVSSDLTGSKIKLIL
jgi:exonuclease SbcC